MALQEIVPGIRVWHWFSEKHGYDFNGHVVGGVAIDPVEMDDATLGELASVERILLTNRNHFRAAEKLRVRSGAKVMVHPADADFVRGKGVQVDEPLAPGQRVGPLVVVAAAGKSPGEVALHWPERRILIVGDACVGKPPGALALLPESVMDDPAALRATLRRLAAEIDFDTLLVGDGASILGGAKPALEALVRRF